MRQEGHGPVFLIVLILSILIMVGAIALIAKNNTEEVKQAQQQIQSGESQAEDISDFIQDVNSNSQAEYDQLEDAIN